MHRIPAVIMFAVAAAAAAARAAAQTTTATPSAFARIAASHPQPGDRIAVHIVGEPYLSDTMMINERGEAPFAKLGLLHVADLTVEALQDTLRARYSEFLRTPAIELAVLRRISVEGEVPRPNVYFIDIATTLRELIARAGGMTEAANRSNVMILREGVRIPIPDWQSNESVASDLKSGDQIVVGRKSWLSLNFIGAISAAGVVASIILAISAR
ncbi:MAG TPA: polysaccharide biosynthesis/export family protein [Gemmatimonadaceae bacterium]